MVRRCKKREGDGERAGEGGDCDRGEEGGEEEEVEKVKWRATTALSGTRSFTALPGLLDTAVELELAPSQSTREAWERSKPRKRTLFHSDVSGEKRKKREQVNRRSPSLFFSPGADASTAKTKEEGGTRRRTFFCSIFSYHLRCDESSPAAWPGLREQQEGTGWRPRQVRLLGSPALDREIERAAAGRPENDSLSLCFLSSTSKYV